MGRVELVRAGGGRGFGVHFQGGDEAHQPALKEMKGRWKHPIAGMGWYKKAKKDFAALPDD